MNAGVPEDEFPPKLVGFTPEQFVPWARSLVAAGHEVHVVYESCGFGFALQRALTAAGARCLVISPQALDETHSGVKTDGRDVGRLPDTLA